MKWFSRAALPAGTRDEAARKGELPRIVGTYMGRCVAPAQGCAAASSCAAAACQSSSAASSVVGVSRTASSETARASIDFRTVPCDGCTGAPPGCPCSGLGGVMPRAVPCRAVGAGERPELDIALPHPLCGESRLS